MMRTNLWLAGIACVGLSLFWNCVCPIALGQDDVLADIERAFRIRLEAVRNLKYQCKQEIGVFEDSDGEVGKRIAKIQPYGFTCWHLEASNRQDTVIFQKQGKNVEYSSNFDTEDGSGTIRSSSGNKVTAFISTKRDALMSMSHYRFWLDIQNWGTNESEYIFSYTLEHYDSARIRKLDDGLIELKTDYCAYDMDRSGGVRELVLDPAKNYLPVRGVFRWKDPDKVGGIRNENFEVLDSTEVSPDVWMPTNISTHLYVAGNDGSEGIHNLIKVKVLEISQGNVTPEDLELDLPDGTKYVDKIKDAAYVGNADGDAHAIGSGRNPPE